MHGEFVEADTCTKIWGHIGHARIVVEISIGFFPISRVKISLEEEKTLIMDIEYETQLVYWIAMLLSPTLMLIAVTEKLRTVRGV